MDDNDFRKWMKSIPTLAQRPVPGVVQNKVEMQQPPDFNAECVTLLQCSAGEEAVQMHLGDNSIIYGHDCNAGCQCGSEHVYQHGCLELTCQRRGSLFVPAHMYSGR